jgi:hypothetical protein
MANANLLRWIDPIEPTAIEHKCEEILDGDKLEQWYNYIVYHFDFDGVYFWARTYLDDIRTVSLHGPFESRATMNPINGSLDETVLAYLKRRFWTVQTLQSDGYAPI